MPRARPELPEVLQRSLKMRVPRFERSIPASVRVSELETYLLESAFVQGDLTEERMEWMSKRVPLQHEWNTLPEGEWGHLRRTRTETAVTHAKAQVRPDLYGDLQDADWMIKRLTEEIDRMERDATKVSRAYTMITGT